MRLSLHVSGPAVLAALGSATVALFIAGSADAIDVESTSATLTPQVLKEIAQVEAEIDRIETQSIDRLAAPPNNQVQQIELLGKAMLYDKELSVNRNEACAFCHMPKTGFTGPVSELNRTTGSYPGSVRTRRLPGVVRRRRAGGGRAGARAGRQPALTQPGLLGV